jgi:hypothetical protein
MALASRLVITCAIRVGGDKRNRACTHEQRLLSSAFSVTPGFLTERVALLAHYFPAMLNNIKWSAVNLKLKASAVAAPAER